jgi:hypothetical protein
MWRRHIVADEETLEDTEIWDYDLGTRGVISAILVTIKATNGETSNLANEIYRCVNRIEVVDGSFKLHSTTAPQNQALLAYSMKEVPPDIIDEAADAEQVGHFGVLFGRRIGDRSYGLDLSKLSNPKLQVDWDITNVRAAGETGYVSGSADISVALVKDDSPGAPTPASFMRATEQYDWTTAASGDERIKLPVEKPWRRLMLRALEDGVAMTTDVTDVRLSMDGDKFVPFEEPLARVLDYNQLELGKMWGVETLLMKSDTGTYNSTVGHIANHSVSSGVASHNALITAAVGNQATFSVYDTATPSAITTDERVYCILYGRGYHSTVLWQWDDEAFFPAPDFGRGDLYVTQGGAGAAASVVLEEVYPL